MIKAFADKHTKELFEVGKSRKVPSDVLSRAIRKLEYVNLATCLDDLKVPPGNKLHSLSDDGKGQYVIAVNDQ
jgi:proteic killer suppression protein